MLDNITIYVYKSMVTYCCCLHAAVPGAYSMLLYNENLFEINFALYCYIFTMATIIFIDFKLFFLYFV